LLLGVGLGKTMIGDGGPPGLGVGVGFWVGTGLGASVGDGGGGVQLGVVPVRM
jgi:hypothetical protein